MIWRLAAASVGMIVFALFWHHGLPWNAIGFTGLVLTAGAIAGHEQRTRTRPADLFGLDRCSIKTVAYAFLGAGLGAWAGLWHRSGLGLPLQPPAGVQPFVIVACLIGAAEELLYRGWLFGHARRFGWPAAVAIAALAHAAYKTALFAWPPMPIAVNLPDMMLWTTCGGIVLGLLRTSSGSIVPAIVAHAAFDFVVYRGMGSAPWWVWG